jgi:purine catabolism regulator
MLAERRAATLALNRLMQRDRETLERQTHRTLLTAILNHAHSSSEISLRARAIGVRLDDKRLVGIVLRLRGHASSLEHQSRLRELTDHAAAAVRDKRLAALIGAVDEHSVGLLLALGRRTARTRRWRVSRRRSASWPDRTAANSPSPWAPPSAPYATRAARCSRPVQVAGRGDPADRRPLVHRLVDVRLRGLLHLLRDDARLQTYVERELGPLLAYDTERGTNLVAMLGIYLDQGRNKSAAADAAHLSRPSFLQRPAPHRARPGRGPRLGRVLPLAARRAARAGSGAEYLVSQLRSSGTARRS